LRRAGFFAARSLICAHRTHYVHPIVRISRHSRAQKAFCERENGQHLGLACLYATIVQSTRECLLLMSEPTVTLPVVLRSILGAYADQRALIRDPDHGRPDRRKAGPSEAPVRTESVSRISCEAASGPPLLRRYARGAGRLRALAVRNCARGNYLSFVSESAEVLLAHNDMATPMCSFPRVPHFPFTAIFGLAKIVLLKLPKCRCGIMGLDVPLKTFTIGRNRSSSDIGSGDDAVSETGVNPGDADRREKNGPQAMAWPVFFCGKDEHDYNLEGK